MRVTKTIKGEQIPYIIKFIPNTMTVEVRYWSEDEPTIGTITNDFNYVLLPQEFLSPYITNVGRVPVGKLKLSKHLRIYAKEYNELQNK